jgi:hypothetical protein
MKWLLAMLCLLAGPAQAQWFNPPAYTIVNSPSIDTNATVEVNTNFANMVTQGNAGMAALLASIAGLGPIGVPNHAVIMWAGNSCPAGYQFADGINGTSDARGLFIRGLDTGGAVDPGRVLASYQADQFQTHTHGNIGAIAPPFQLGWPTGVDQALGTYTALTETTTTMITGTPGAYETRPAALVLIHCEAVG